MGHLVHGAKNELPLCALHSGAELRERRGEILPVGGASRAMCGHPLCVDTEEAQDKSVHGLLSNVSEVADVSEPWKVKEGNIRRKEV